MISPPYFTANSRASFDFPVPVAPHTTITGEREFKSLVVVLDNPKAAIFKQNKTQSRQSTNAQRNPEALFGSVAPSQSFPFLYELISHSTCEITPPPKKNILYNFKPHIITIRFS